jgi:hypothetical protein
MIYPDQTPRQIDLFTTYLEINEIAHTPQWLEIAQLIIDQTYPQIVPFHQWWFLRYYFDQLVKHEISFEHFMLIGDIEWQIEDQINPHIYREEHPAHLDSISPEMVALWTSETLVIVDPLIYAYYIHHHGWFVTDAKILVLQ